MQMHRLHFLPYPEVYLAIFLLVLGVLFIILQLRLVAYAYERLGLTRRGAMAVLFGSLLGSGINIPVAELPSRTMIAPGVVDYFGMQYVVPMVMQQDSTIIAVNVGGAIIPVLVTLLLMARYGFSRRAFAVLAFATILVHLLAQPVPGVGIAMPPFLPPIVIAVAALLIDPSAAPRTAFISGTLGTLIGADLLNLGRIRDLGAPVASIGGAGTFDGIFLVGILAVLLTTVPMLGHRIRGKLGLKPHPQEPPISRAA